MSEDVEKRRQRHPFTEAVVREPTLPVPSICTPYTNWGSQNSSQTPAAGDLDEEAMSFTSSFTPSLSTDRTKRTRQSLSLPAGAAASHPRVDHAPPPINEPGNHPHSVQERHRCMRPSFLTLTLLQRRRLGWNGGSGCSLHKWTGAHVSTGRASSLGRYSGQLS